MATLANRGEAALTGKASGLPSNTIPERDRDLDDEMPF